MITLFTFYRCDKFVIGTPFKKRKADNTGQSLAEKYLVMEVTWIVNSAWGALSLCGLVQQSLYVIWWISVKSFVLMLFAELKSDNVTKVAKYLISACTRYTRVLVTWCVVLATNSPILFWHQLLWKVYSAAGQLFSILIWSRIRNSDSYFLIVIR